MQNYKTKSFAYFDGNKDKEAELVFKTLPPSKSLIFLMYLGKILGGQAGKAVASFSGNVKSLEDLTGLKGKDLDLEKLGNALFGIFERLDDDETVERLNILLGSVQHEGNKLHVDYFIFENNLKILFPVIKEALAVNYKDFLQGSSGTLAKIVKSAEILQSGKE